MQAGIIINVAICIGLYCLTGVAFAQKFTFKEGIKKDALRFKLVRNLIIVPLYINDKGPFNFILDTGVGPMIITDTQLVDSLKIENLIPYKLMGAGSGAEFETFVTNDITAEIGKASIAGMPTVLIVNAPFDLSSYVGIPIQGIIGYYFFNSFLVKINYAWKRLVFYSPNSSKRRRGERIPIELINQKPYVNVTIHTEATDTSSIKARLILDTGASHAVSLETIGGEPFPTPSKAITASLGVGLSGLINGLIGRVNQIDIGSFSFNEVIASFPDYEDVAAKVNTQNRNGTLGGELLKRFRVFIDYNDEAIYLKRNRHYNDPFEHDMSGMEIYLEFGAYNRYFISRIEAGSPAEEADLHIHDELISIDFNSVRKKSLDDVYHVFKSGGQKTVILEIMRNDMLIFKLLNLEPRI